MTSTDSMGQQITLPKLNCDEDVQDTVEMKIKVEDSQDTVEIKRKMEEDSVNDIHAKKIKVVEYENKTEDVSAYKPKTEWSEKYCKETEKIDEQQTEENKIEKEEYIEYDTVEAKRNDKLKLYVELNNTLLNTLFRFKRYSKLKSFISNKTGVTKRYYRLIDILNSLKKIIREENLFDQTNPSIILCSPELEGAINQKALHVTEVRDHVLVQLIRVCNKNMIENSAQIVYTAPGPILSLLSKISTYKNAQFTLKPKFLEVLHSVEGADQAKTYFCIEEITLLLSKYIIARKDKLFDSRNIKIALVQSDPLGAAFGVKAFHRCQIIKLLQSQLINSKDEQI